MFIDAHSHLFQELYTCSNLQPNVRLEGVEIYFRDKIPESVNDLEGVNVDEFLQKMDKSNIKCIVTIAQDMTRSMNCWVGSNALAADLQSRSKGKIIGIAGLDPIDTYDRFHIKNLNNFEFYVKKRGLRGLFFSPTYEHFLINDRRAYPFYSRALELDVPLYIHQGPQYNPPPDFTPLEYGRIWLLDQVTADFPDLRMNIEHMAFPWTQELLAIMAHTKNVYTDTADLIRRPTILAWNMVMAKEYRVLDRVMYGSDYVGNNVSGYLEKVKRETDWIKFELNKIIQNAGWPCLTENEIDGILMDNALKFLKHKI